MLPTFTLAWLCSCCSPCPECPFALLPLWIYPSKSDSRVQYADSPFLSSQAGLVVFFPGPPKHLASASPLLWFTPLWIVLVYVFIFFTFFYKLLEVLSHPPETITISLGLAACKVGYTQIPKPSMAQYGQHAYTFTVPQIAPLLGKGLVLHEAPWGS